MAGIMKKGFKGVDRTMLNWRLKRKKDRGRLMGEPRMAGRKKSKFEGKDELCYRRITNRGRLDIKSK